MDTCCSVETTGTGGNGICPQCGTKGKAIDLITLKSLLLPFALGRLEADKTYHFCSDSECDTVYFAESISFTVDELKVPVFQKNSSLDVPACYCFNWTRDDITDEIKETGKSTAVEQITHHIKAGRCGCEVNNPQGSCCLGNVRSVAKKAQATVDQ